jgi:hypothetical protein
MKVTDIDLRLAFVIVDRVASCWLAEPKLAGPDPSVFAFATAQATPDMLRPGNPGWLRHA